MIIWKVRSEGQWAVSKWSGANFVGSVGMPSEIPARRLSVLLAENDHLKIPFWLENKPFETASLFKVFSWKRARGKDIIKYRLWLKIACGKAVYYSKQQNPLPAVVGCSEVACVGGSGIGVAENKLRHYYYSLFVYLLITMLFFLYLC